MRSIAVCRLVGGVTYVHARVLPALVRLAEQFPRERIARCATCTRRPAFT
jgi:hypothetical protein